MRDDRAKPGRTSLPGGLTPKGDPAAGKINARFTRRGDGRGRLRGAQWERHEQILRVVSAPRLGGFAGRLAARVDVLHPPSLAGFGPAIRLAVETGVASWYGPGFDGRPTSSREVYDMQAMTAAHPWLPFDTRLRVTNLDNGLAAEVRINDRGPFVGGRVIDLSFAAANRLGMIGPGTARVRLEVSGAPPRRVDLRRTGGRLRGRSQGAGPSGEPGRRLSRQSPSKARPRAAGALQGSDPGREPVRGRAGGGPAFPPRHPRPCP